MYRYITLLRDEGRIAIYKPFGFSHARDTCLNRKATLPNCTFSHIKAQELVIQRDIGIKKYTFKVYAYGELYSTVFIYILYIYVACIGSVCAFLSSCFYVWLAFFFLHTPLHVKNIHSYAHGYYFTLGLQAMGMWWYPAYDPHHRHGDDQVRWTKDAFSPVIFFFFFLLLLSFFQNLDRFILEGVQSGSF